MEVLTHHVVPCTRMLISSLGNLGFKKVHQIEETHVKCSADVICLSFELESAATSFTVD